MTQKWLSGPVLGLAIILASCEKPPAPDTREADAKAITAIEEDWSKALAAKDAVKFTSQYSADASVYFPDMPAMQGTAAISAFVKDWMADPNFGGSFKTTKVTVAKSGDLASSEGTYQQNGTHPITKKLVSETGHYLTTWKKQEDGSWKAINDMIVAEKLTATAPSKPAAKKKKKR